MGFTRGQIEAARRNQERIQRRLGERVHLEDGVMDFKVDARLYHNARLSEQRDHGVPNCWEEKEFVEDMKRKHPEIAVRSRSRKIRISNLKFQISEGLGKLTRFGRVTFHKSYAS